MRVARPTVGQPTVPAAESVVFDQWSVANRKICKTTKDTKFTKISFTILPFFVSVVLFVVNSIGDFD